VPQPDLPAPLAQRPEPGAQLLEAVRLRQAQRSLQLAQHWVHRRGVVDLQRFCSTVLSSEQGAQAVAWLQGLLGLNDETVARDDATQIGDQPAEQALPAASDASPAPLPVSSLSSDDAGSERQDEAPGAAGPLRLSLTSADRPQQLPLEQPEVLDRNLQERAVAAVDAAFAALAQTFEEKTAEEKTAATHASVAPMAAPLSCSAPPQPLPVRVGLWPSLRASAASLHAAQWPGGGSLATAAADHPGGPPVVIANQEPTPAADASAPSKAGLESPLRDEWIMQTRAEENRSMIGEIAAVAAPLQSPLPAPPEPPADLPGADASGMDCLPDAAAPLAGAAWLEECADEAGPPAATAAEIEDAAGKAMEQSQPGALQRLRCHLRERRLPRFTRLRSVLRDCLEETVALLRTPETEDSVADDFEASHSPQPSQSLPAASGQPLAPPQPLAASRPPQPSRPQPPAEHQTPERPAPLPVPQNDSSPETLFRSIGTPRSTSAEPTSTTAGSDSSGSGWQPAAVPADHVPAMASDPAPAGPDPASAASPTPASAAAPAADPAPVSPPRPNPAARHSGSGRQRPAPAPASLSDLQAWLPGRSDLPRAS